MKKELTYGDKRVINGMSVLVFVVTLPGAGYQMHYFGKFEKNDKL